MNRLLNCAFFLVCLCPCGSGQTYTISTFVGGGLQTNIPGTSASLDSPQGVAVDSAGNLYIADQFAVFELNSQSGILAVVAGNGTPGFSGDDGLATSAQLNAVSGIALDAAGNLYIADSNNNRIRKVSNEVITTVAGTGTKGFSGDNGPAANAQLNTPSGVAVDTQGNLYIADSYNNRIRKVSGGVITTIAGSDKSGFSGDNGLAMNAQLYDPLGISTDAAGNVYFADSLNARVREISNGTIATVAGGGTSLGENGLAVNALLNAPAGVAVDKQGNLYIADCQSERVRRVSNGAITTVAGTGTAGFAGDSGPALNALLGCPVGVAVDPAGNTYIADFFNHRVRRVSNTVITTVAGGGAALGDNGPALSAQLLDPSGIAADRAGNVFIADRGHALVRKVSGGSIVTVAGGGTSAGDNIPATTALLLDPRDVAVDSSGNLYIADLYTVRKVSNGIISTVAGNGKFGFSGDGGPAKAAMLGDVAGVAVDASGNVYIADEFNNRVRKVSGGVITTVAGTDSPGFSGDGGPAIVAHLNSPSGLAVDSAGNLFIADTLNYRVRKVSNGIITTVAGGAPGFSGDNGPATSAAISGPIYIAVDASGNLYIADVDRGIVRKVSNGVITTLAENGAGVFIQNGGPATTFSISGLGVDSAGNVYFSDSSPGRIRVLIPNQKPSISPDGIVPIYGTAPVIQSGAWVSIYGSDLASATTLWNGDFPTSLGNTTVTIDNKPAYLWLVSPTQINLQAPDDSTTGLVNVVVTAPFGAATSTVTLAPQAPSFSLLGDGRHVAAEIATPNGTGSYAGGAYDLVGPVNTFSYPTRPVRAGETLVLFGVGFGPTMPAVAAGKPFSGSAPTTSPVIVTIGGVIANTLFSGITEAGLYQINVTVPAGLTTGELPITATVGGAQTPTGVVVSLQ